MDNRTQMRVAGEPLYMRFDTQAWLEVEECFGSLDEMDEAISGKDKPMHARLEMIAILARAGARYSGVQSKADVAWMREHMTPRQVMQGVRLCREAILRGMRRETIEQEDEAIDVVAAEIAKKKDMPSRPDDASATR